MIINLLLTFAEAPMCVGRNDLMDGGHAKLTCKAKFSGNNIPTLQWMRGTEALEQMDEFNIQLAQVSKHKPSKNYHH